MRTVLRGALPGDRAGRRARTEAAGGGLGVERTVRDPGCAGSHGSGGPRPAAQLGGPSKMDLRVATPVGSPEGKAEVLVGASVFGIEP